MKYYGDNYDIMIPHNSSGNEYFVEKEDLALHLPPWGTVFEMQLLALDNAGNVIVSDWFDVTLE